MARFLIIVGIILLVGLAAIGFLVIRQSRDNQSVSQPIVDTVPATGNTPVGTLPGTTVNQNEPAPVVTTPSIPPRAPAEVAREVFIKNFVERYGSYSTDAPYENFRRTRDMMTERLWKDAERTMAKKPGGAFYQVITRVQSVHVQEEVGDHVVFGVSTTREEERGTSASTIVRKVAAVTALKVGEGWRVDRVEWK